MTAQAIHGQIVLEEFDVVFGLSSLDVVIVEGFRMEIRSVGDHKTTIRTQVVDFHFGHHPARSIPTVGLIEKLGKTTLFDLFFLEVLTGFFEEFFHCRFQTRVTFKSNHVAQGLLLFLAVFIQLGRGKSTVGSNLDLEFPGSF